jgi:pre-mRNA-processing factor SLU7
LVSERDKGTLTILFLLFNFQGPRVTKFRKGACTNCGAITHDSKSNPQLKVIVNSNIACLERPRKIGAKYSKSNFGRDEIIEDFEFDYDGKRDRWNGYVGLI